MTSLPIVREYDQVLTGNVKIKKISHGDSDHMITFSKKKISTIFIYQVLSRSNTLNQNREFNELKATEWVKRAFSNPAFTPTTVMKLQYGECPFHHKNDKKDHCDKYAVCRHVFVINRAKVNKCGQVVFYVSSDVMTLPPKPNKYLESLKLAKKIPTTKCNEEFHNVQFAIDDLSYQDYWVQSPVPGSIFPTELADLFTIGTQVYISQDSSSPAVTLYLNGDQANIVKIVSINNNQVSTSYALFLDNTQSSEYPYLYGFNSVNDATTLNTSVFSVGLTSINPNT
jgi:hypothetical protein